MADWCTHTERTVYQPLHPSIIPKLENAYVELHRERFQFIKSDTEWNPDLRTAPSRFASTSSEPVEVGDARVVNVGNFELLIYTPKGVPPTTGWPALLGFHGGGWVLGDVFSDEHIWRLICRDARCVVISVGYRLAPDHRHPVAVEDGFDALKWVIQKGPFEISIDKWCILIAGMSSGGNLAAVTTLKAAGVGLHVNLRAQILMVPVCDNTATAESETWLQRPYAPLLTPRRMTFFQELYLGDRDSPTWAGEDWTASPVRAPQDLLQKCPKTTIIAAEQDLLYPESLVFARELRKVGVDVDVKIYEGATHPFMAMDKHLDSGRHAIRYVVERVKEILAEYVEHSLDIKPSDIKSERDRQTLSEQAKMHRNIGRRGEPITSSQCHQKPDR